MRNPEQRSKPVSVEMDQRQDCTRLSSAIGGKSFDLAGESWVAGEPGFEPRQTESESVVLPLHHSPPKQLILLIFLRQFCKLANKPCKPADRQRSYSGETVHGPALLTPFPSKAALHSKPLDSESDHPRIRPRRLHLATPQGGRPCHPGVPQRHAEAARGPAGHREPGARRPGRSVPRLARPALVDASRRSLRRRRRSRSMAAASHFANASLAALRMPCRHAWWRGIALKGGYRRPTSRRTATLWQAHGRPSALLGGSGSPCSRYCLMARSRDERHRAMCRRSFGMTSSAVCWRSIRC
jgi:hypothetical protein